jgi:hypothetical protein
MMTNGLYNYMAVKEKIIQRLFYVLKENHELQELLYNLFVEGTAFIVGGFIRDAILNKISRDLDIVVTSSHAKLSDLIFSSGLSFKENRFNGFKIFINDWEIDIWSIEDNWAFRTNVVSKNENKLLESIAKGCFYNYDSLVMNINSAKINIKHYNKFLETNTLDIIQKRTLYKKLNPSIEANILRAFYIKNLYNVSFSCNCQSYLSSRIGYLNDKYGSAIERLLIVKYSYPKYDSDLDIEFIKRCIEDIKQESNQKTFDFLGNNL